MKDIDLTQFANHAQKLPAKYLNHYITPYNATTRTILYTHFMDFIVCVMGATFMASLYNFSVRTLLVTKNLRSAFAAQDTIFISMLLLPALILSYFCLCYFLNDGQTLGMHWNKNRLAIKKQMDFQESYQWAFESFMLIMSGGISYLFRAELWQSFQQQDYRYQEFMWPKEDYTLDLVALTDISQAQPAEEELQQAA